MTLPFAPPLAPMLSTAAEDLPGGEGWLFEPKWDGFRTLVFRDGDELLLQSRDEKPMNRYFPELVAPLAAALPERCVLDGEIVIVGPAGLDFEALLLRIHPAESRVQLLASQTPASYVAWDVLALGDEDLRDTPLETRRAKLDKLLGDGVESRSTSPPRRATAPWRRTGSAASKAPASTASWPSASTSPTFPGKRDDAQGQAPADRRLRRRRIPMAQERPGHDGRLPAPRPLRRRTGRCTTSASPRPSRPPGARSWSRSCRPCARTPSRIIPGATGRRRRTRLPRRDSAAPARRAAGTAARTSRGSRSDRSASAKWRTTTCRGRDSATRRISCAGGRTSRRRTAATTSSKSRPRTSSSGSSGHLASAASPGVRLARRPLPETAPGIVVGIGRLGLRTVRLRNVPQVHADPRPGAGSPAHRVDEDVVGLELRRRRRMARLPALEAGERLGLVLRLRHRDERLARSAPARGRLDLSGRLAALRRRDARRLAALLLVVRRPGSVAETFGLLRGGEREERRRASPRSHRSPRARRRAPRTGPARSRA